MQIRNLFLANKVTSAAMLLLLSLDSSAQSPVVPTVLDVTSPAFSGDLVTARIATGLSECFSEFESSSVDVNGYQIDVRFSVVDPDPTVCPGTPPPMILEQPLGELPSGTYTLTVFGRDRDQDMAPVDFVFGVQPAPVSVPLGGGLPIGILLLLAGCWALTRRRY